MENSHDLEQRIKKTENFYNKVQEQREAGNANIMSKIYAHDARNLVGLYNQIKDFPEEMKKEFLGDLEKQLTLVEKTEGITQIDIEKDTRKGTSLPYEIMTEIKDAYNNIITTEVDTQITGENAIFNLNESGLRQALMTSYQNALKFTPENKTILVDFKENENSYEILMENEFTGKIYRQGFGEGSGIGTEYMNAYTKGLGAKLTNYSKSKLTNNPEKIWGVELNIPKDSQNLELNKK